MCSPTDRELPSGIRINAANPMLLLARSSSETGKKAVRLVTDDLRGAIEVVKQKLGWDLSEHELSYDEVTSMMAAVERHVSIASTGTKVVHKFVEIDLVRECGLYVLLATGSGRKLDDADLQPFVTRSAEVARSIGAVLLASKRLDRAARNAWAVGPLMLAMENTAGAMILDETQGLREVNNPMSASMTFMSMGAGQEEANNLVAKAERGKRYNTGPRMENGRVRYHLHQVAPAGLARVTYREGNGLGAKELVLDTPAIVLDPEIVGLGIPKVETEDEKRVDQVANVRWALKAIASGMGATDVGHGLIARGFSTERTRQDDPAGRHTKPKNAYTAVVANLDMYRTGRLERGVGGTEPVVIENIFPLDGPWASEETWLKIDRRTKRTYSKSTFAGLHVRMNGYPGVLRAQSNPKANMYRVIDLEALAESHCVPTYATLDGSEFAEAVYQALRRAGDTPLELLDESMAADAVLGPRQELHQVTQAIAHLEARLTGLRSRLEATTADGLPIITDALASDLNDEYNELAAKKNALTADQEALDQKIEDHRQRTAREMRHIGTDKLLQLLASLHDPTNTDYKKLWQRCLQNVEITSRDLRIAGHTGKEVRIRGRLAFTGTNGTYSIPIDHTYLVGKVTRIPERVEAIIEELASGTPLSDSKVPGARALRPVVCEKLGESPKHFLVAEMDDPRILRATMNAAYLRAGRSVEQMAKDLGEPPEFIERILATHARLAQKGRALWLQPEAPIESAMVRAAAADNEGIARREVLKHLMKGRASALSASVSRSAHRSEWTSIPRVGYQLSPCGKCGSHRRAKMLLHHVEGLLCLECRHDQGGLEWDAAYDRYSDASGMPASG